MPLTVPLADVESWLGLTAGQDSTHTTPATKAAEAYVNGLPWADGLDEWPDDGRKHGAVMLAARLYRRRNTPSGVEPFGADAATFVTRTDPDVARLLRIGASGLPRTG